MSVATLVESMKELDNEKLAKQIDIQNKDVQTLSKSTIINKWNLGGQLTANQLKEIRSMIEPQSIKSFVVQRAILDKKTGEFKGYEPVTKYVNKMVTRLDSAITAGLVTDEEIVINVNILEADNSAELNAKMLDVSHARAELYGLKAVSKAREAAASRATLEKKGLHIQSLKEIYQRAVASQKLTEADRAEITLETAADMSKEAKDAVTEKLLHTVTETPIFV